MSLALAAAFSLYMVGLPFAFGVVSDFPFKLDAKTLVFYTIVYPVLLLIVCCIRTDDYLVRLIGEK